MLQWIRFQLEFQLSDLIRLLLPFNLTNPLQVLQGMLEVPDLILVRAGQRVLGHEGALTTGGIAGGIILEVEDAGVLHPQICLEEVQFVLDEVIVGLEHLVLELEVVLDRLKP